MECPTCGQNVSRTIPEQFAEEAMDLQALFNARGSKLTRTQAKLLAAIRGKNRPVSYATISDKLYGWRPDGEIPTDDTMKVMATKCRQAIVKAGLPWRIVCHWGFGYELQEDKPILKRTACALLVLLPLGQVILSRIP